MKLAPPTSAPATPLSRQAQKIASCVEAGPGSRVVAAIASSNSRSLSHARRWTHSLRRSAMCAGGPPKPIQPMRPHSRATTRSGTGSATRGLGPGRLKELDRVAGRILEQDLLAARSGHDVVAERHARGAQAFDLGSDVVDDEVDAV